MIFLIKCKVHSGVSIPKMFLGDVNMQTLTTKIYCVAYYSCSVNQTDSWHGVVGIIEEELRTIQKLCNAIRGTFALC